MQISSKDRLTLNYSVEIVYSELPFRRISRIINCVVCFDLNLPNGTLISCSTEFIMAYCMNMIIDSI